jgi:CubicO group peptidase (beta-lactamase class C family)
VSSIEGDVEPGFEAVADAFRRNFDEHNDLGAAVAVYAGGRAVVDLWGGIADTRVDRPWDRDTIALVFSTTKGATALCAHMLVERGELDLDAPVANYWPEFAQNGKDKVPVRWLLTHQVGLPAVEATFEELCEHEPVIRKLEAAEPLWERGTHIAYHALTYGHLVGEVVKRVSGRRIGSFFAEEVAAPLGLRSWIGLPEAEVPNIAWLERGPKPDASGPIAAIWEALLAPGTVWNRSVTFGSALTTDLITADGGGFNDPALLAVDLGSSNLVTDARSLARMYAATVGEVDGVRLLRRETVDAARQVQTEDVPFFGLPEMWTSLGLPKPMNFALGFSALTPSAFGAGGAGGSLGFADVHSGVGFGFVLNRMDAESPDTRSANLAAAVRACT